jgi:hypothetical protein
LNAIRESRIAAQRLPTARSRDRFRALRSALPAFDLDRRPLTSSRPCDFRAGHARSRARAAIETRLLPPFPRCYPSQLYLDHSPWPEGSCQLPSPHFRLPGRSTIAVFYVGNPLAIRNPLSSILARFSACRSPS